MGGEYENNEENQNQKIEGKKTPSHDNQLVGKDYSQMEK